MSCNFFRSSNSPILKNIAKFLGGKIVLVHKESCTPFAFDQIECLERIHNDSSFGSLYKIRVGDKIFIAKQNKLKRDIEKAALEGNFSNLLLNKRNVKEELMGTQNMFEEYSALCQANLALPDIDSTVVRTYAFTEYHIINDRHEVLHVTSTIFYQPCQTVLREVNTDLLIHGNMKGFIRVYCSVLENIAEIAKIGLVHLDLKDNNVMLCEGKIKLIDFGLILNKHLIYNTSRNPGGNKMNSYFIRPPSNADKHSFYTRSEQMFPAIFNFAISPFYDAFGLANPETLLSAENFYELPTYMEDIIFNLLETLDCNEYETQVLNTFFEVVKNFIQQFLGDNNNLSYDGAWIDEIPFLIAYLREISEKLPLFSFDERVTIQQEIL